MLNLTTKSTYYFVDSYGMMLRQDLNGTGELGERDSIGRTFEYIWTLSYDDGHKHAGKLFHCLDENEQLYRHPSLVGGYNDCSRDHVLYWVMTFRLFGVDLGFLFDWKISDTAHLDLSSYAYLRKKWWLYYLVNIPLHLFFNLYQPIMIRLNPKWIFPRVYSLYNTSIQVHLLPDSRRKKKLQRLLLKLAHPDNLWIRLLNGDKTVTKEQIDAYKSVSGDPASSVGYYDTRTHKVLTDEQKAFNDIPKDMLVMLYNKLHSEDKII